MTKHEITKQFLAAQEAVEAARKTLETAMSDLKKVEKLIEEHVKKPMIHYKDGRSFEIVKYNVYHGGDYIEFETSGYKYRYYLKHTYYKHVFPSSIPKFKTFDIISKSWVYAELIDHLELLEGVDEYDNSNSTH